MSLLDRDTGEKLLYAVSHSSEPPQVLDVEVQRLRPMPMECRCPSNQYICDNVKFGESRNAVPSKGLFEGGGEKLKKMIFL